MLIIQGYETIVNKTYDVPYMERTRLYYEAQGYSEPYAWAHFANTPFSALQKPLSESTVSLITTAMPDTEQGRSERKLYSSLTTPVPETMYTLGLSWHDTVTHTQDIGSFLPIEPLLVIQDEGGIGSLAPRFHSVHTAYSQRQTLEEDAPELLERLREDQTDVALLVPL